MNFPLLSTIYHEIGKTVYDEVFPIFFIDHSGQYESLEMTDYSCPDESSFAATEDGFPIGICLGKSNTELTTMNGSLST